MECGERETACFVRLMTESEPDPASYYCHIAQSLLLKLVGMEERR